HLTVETLERREMLNGAPMAMNDSYSVVHGHTLSLSAPGILANDVDPDHDPLTAIQMSAPAHGTLTLNANGSLTYVAANSYVGQDSFTYKASDGMLQSNVATVTINVTDQPPAAVNNTYSVLHDHTLNVAAPGCLANDTDADSDALTAVQ